MIENLLEEYRGKDSNVRSLLHFWNIYVVPSLNPDGKKKDVLNFN